jgi:ketosteroid isomerase-like protein
MIATMSIEAIRAARAAINDAIARRDPHGIGAFLLDDYHVVTARGVQRSGKDESVRGWEEMFARDANATFVRTPIEFEVNDELGMAHEYGRWEGPELAGVYSAKWHRTADGWRLQAEIFTPTAARRA